MHSLKPQHKPNTPRDDDAIMLLFRTVNADFAENNKGDGWNAATSLLAKKDQMATKVNKDLHK